MNAPLCDWELAVELACDHANNHGYADQENRLQIARDCLTRLGWGNATFGVEYASIPDQNPNGPECDYELAYLNAGDTYELTVLDYDGKCQPGTWGDWYESSEQEYETENNVIRCGYCGEYTPFDYENAEPGDWRDCMCESCGHLIGG